LRLDVFEIFPIINQMRQLYKSAILL
jgi:hypothetical protein